jgi:hypothetical protein
MRYGKWIPACAGMTNENFSFVIVAMRAPLTLSSPRTRGEGESQGQSPGVPVIWKLLLMPSYGVGA